MGDGTLTDAMNVVELIEWFEDVASARAGTRLVTLPARDPLARLATLRAFYQGLAEHRSFGPVWPTELPAGALAPTFSAEYFLPTPKFTWLGISASHEPVAEAIQLAEQLEALAGLTNAPAWVREASAGPFRATLAPQRFDGAGDSADHTFAALGNPVGGIATTLSTAARLLDDVIEPHRLIPDGGALQIDAPRPRARATIAAAWLQRLASDSPIVFVVDEAQKAGPFLAELVDLLLAVDAPILVVLAGEPFSESATDPQPYRARRGRPAPAADTGTRLAGRFNTYVGQAVAAVCLPGGSLGLLTAALAASVPQGVFTVGHVDEATTALGIEDSRGALRDLLQQGWFRRLTGDVFAFVNDERHSIAVEQARGTLSDDHLKILHRRISTDVARRAPDDESLRTIVELTAAGTTSSDLAWRAANALAAHGHLDRAVRLAPPMSDARAAATVDAWRQAGGTLASIDPAQDAEPDAMVIRAALIARRDPVASNALLARAIGRLDMRSDDGFTDALRHRLATARIFLANGDLAGVERALGDDLRHWLSAPAADQLVRLSTWRNQTGMVARSLDALENLELINVLRAVMPNSVALTYALIARLELLEKLGRLDTADDAHEIAWEAGHLLSQITQRRPAITWRAVRWLAWANQRRGETATALALLDQLLAEQTAVLPADHPGVLDTRTWKTRCLLEAGRFEEAHAEIDDVLRQRLRTVEDDHVDMLAARHWHGEILAKLGDHRAAVEEMTGVVAHRERTLPPDDEELLASRHRLGAELANVGRFPDALRQLNEVVARRSLLDIDDAPRLLAARHARGVCLLMAGRHTEALYELDQVLAHREHHLAADAPVLVNARADRATCLLVVGRASDALAELDTVVALRSARSAQDDPALVNARQQRVNCLLGLGRTQEAVAEIDTILASTATWPADDRMLTELRAVRAQLQPA